MNATAFKVHTEVMSCPTCFFCKQLGILLCFSHRRIQSMVCVKLLLKSNNTKEKRQMKKKKS